MGWAGASPPMAGEGASHRQDVSVTSLSQKRNLVDFKPKRVEIKSFSTLPENTFAEGRRIDQNSWAAAFFYTVLWIQQEPGFCLHCSFTPKPPVPVSPGPTQHLGMLGGCTGDSPHGLGTGMATARPQLGTELAAPAAHAQQLLSHLTAAKSYGCPETHGHSRWSYLPRTTLQLSATAAWLWQ